MNHPNQPRGRCGWRMLEVAVAVIVFLGAGSVFVRAAETSPVMVQSAPGRFEVAAVDASVAYAVAAAGEEAWRHLSAPLELPDAFSSPVFVRVVPTEGTDSFPFTVTVEAAGIVSVRLRTDAATGPIARRALTQGLLMRLAVARHGVNERLTAPLWLEQACVGWWQSRTDGAQLDALRQESARQATVKMDVLLNWQREGEESRAKVLAAVWLLTFLQTESGRGREWSMLLPRLLAGDEPLGALAASFPGRFQTAEERELWWQTGYQSLRRVRALPVLDAAESRLQLGALTRFVFAGAEEEIDAVVPLRDVMARTNEAIVTAELARRSTELGKLIPALHPFYRNAGLSLAEVLGSAGRGKAERRDSLCATFEQDWRDANELEAASTAALDRMETRLRQP